MASPSGAPDPRTKPATAWRVFAVLLLAFALGARFANLVTRGPLADYDAAGHLISTATVLDGNLPHPTSWSGHHPPLYYIVGAGLVRTLPPNIPVHVALRLLSLAAGIGSIGWVWWTLRRRFAATDAEVASVFLACLPVFIIATSMLGNETLCVFFVTATLALLVDRSESPDRRLRRSAKIGLVAGLAVLSKITGWIVIGVALFQEMLRRRRTPAAAAGHGLVIALIPACLVAPWVLWWVYSGFSPLVALSGASVSPDLNAVAEFQTQRVREWSDYVRFPAAAFLEPSRMSDDLNESVFGLLYASVWADPHEHFFPERSPRMSLMLRVIAFGGLLPVLLATWGTIRIARDRKRYSWAFTPLLYAALLLFAFLANTLRYSSYAVVKANFLLSALLPAAIVLAAGLGALPPALRALCRGGLLALALLCVATFWTPGGGP